MRQFRRICKSGHGTIIILGTYIRIYPGAEHGITEYEVGAEGERLSTRYAPGYFQMMADRARDGRIGEQYGNAELTRPRAFGGAKAE